MSEIFFIDRDLGKTFPAMLTAAGIDTRPYHTVYARDDVPDADWLARCGLEGWYALTHDKSIGRRRRSRGAFPEVFASGVGLIILRGQRTTRDLAESFICSQERIDSFLVSTARPFVAKFFCSDERYTNGDRKPGRLELIMSSPSTKRKP